MEGESAGAGRGGLPRGGDSLSLLLLRVCWRGGGSRASQRQAGNVPAGALGVGGAAPCYALRPPRAQWGPARSFREGEVGRPDAGDAEGDFARFSDLSRFSFVFWGSSACKLWGSVTLRALSRQAVSEGPGSQPRRPSHQVARGGRAGLLRQTSVPRRSQVCITRYNQSVWCCALVLTPRGSVPSSAPQPCSI